MGENMKKKYKYGICGPFDFEEKSTGGQSVKTREFYYALRDSVGSEKIKILESTSYKKNPINFLSKMVKLFKNCENIIIFPAQKGILVFSPLCGFLKNMFGAKTYYSVIGGWLAKIVDKNLYLKKSLIKFDSILVETSIMEQELGILDIKNVTKLENFKNLTPVREDEIKKVSNPIKLCYFSRVTKMKGIEDVVSIVKKLNEKKIVCVLDIYGPITDGYDGEFLKLQSNFTKEISYKGKIRPEESVNVISKYDLQIFPTRYKTEGIPGAILDSYFAGVPVIAAKWNSFSDVINDGETGIGYEMNNLNDFYVKMKEIIDNPDKINNMKYLCLNESKKYMPEVVIEKFIEIVGR